MLSTPWLPYGCVQLAVAPADVKGRLNASVDEQGLTACRTSSKDHLAVIHCTHEMIGWLARGWAAHNSLSLQLSLFTGDITAESRWSAMVRTQIVLCPHHREHIPAVLPGDRLCPVPAQPNRAKVAELPHFHPRPHMCASSFNTCPSLLSAAGRTVNCWL